MLDTIGLNLQLLARRKIPKLKSKLKSKLKLKFKSKLKFYYVHK